LAERAIDAAATKAARKRHQRGIARLDDLFAVTQAHRDVAALNPQNGSQLRVKLERLRWRQWRDAIRPGRVRARRRRKLANASRRRNRT
jgi:hypothetical protein